jgi:hypothetical protein
VDGEGAGRRDQAQPVPGEAEVGPVDADLGVEPDLAVAGTDAAASKDSGRVRPRTVSAAVTATSWPDGRMRFAVKVMSGWLPMSKKSAERRCVSRRVFLVSMDAAAIVTVPLTWPSGETVPFPLTSRKTPFTGTRPMTLLVSLALDLAGSRAHSPARVPSFSSARTTGTVTCPDGASMTASLSYRTD